MNPTVAAIAKGLAILTAITDACIVLFVLSAILSLISKKFSTIREKFLKSVAPHTRVMAFAVAFAAMAGSLFYSEVAKFSPCILCWYQRILMYPQTLLLAMGIVKHDKNITDYIMGLSAVGALLAAYHYYIQLGGNKLIPCTTVGYSIDCSQRFSLEFGYITIPMMSLTAFIAIFLLMRVAKRYGKNS